MRKLPLFLLALAFLAGCATSDSGLPTLKLPSSGVSKTFDIPIAKVKPAFVTTVVQMGMSIAAIETRGKNEVLKARRADRNVEIEFERLGASSTRVRVSGSDEARIMSDTEKRLNAG
jgi:hypothetical protein